MKGVTDMWAVDESAGQPWERQPWERQPWEGQSATVRVPTGVAVAVGAAGEGSEGAAYVLEV